MHNFNGFYQLTLTFTQCNVMTGLLSRDQYILFLRFSYIGFEVEVAQY